MIAEILAIGHEVVDGTVLNTNASWLAQQLHAIGVQVRFHSAVPDDEDLILRALSQAEQRADCVLVTGGLGPTVDDFTLEVAARFLGRPLVEDPSSLEQIRERFLRLGREMSPNQAKQAWVPEGSVVMGNRQGTAPGVYFRTDRALFAFFPGVPTEMKAMFQESLLPVLLKQLPAGNGQVLRVLRCFGLPEGQMDQMLRERVAGRSELMGVNLGFRVRFPTIDVRLSATGPQAEVAARLEQAAAWVRLQLGDVVFGEADEELAQWVGKLLQAKGLTLATAESCTGGLLADEITNVPGASQYYRAGVVSYSNEAKTSLLEVSPDLLKEWGAVSAPVALAMAHGVKQISGADFAVGITGIAGPDGGSAEKPVGTVHVAVVHPQGEWEQAYFFPWDRRRFKQVVVAVALDRLRRILLR